MDINTWNKKQISQQLQWFKLNSDYDIDGIPQSKWFINKIMEFCKFNVNWKYLIEIGCGAYPYIKWIDGCAKYAIDPNINEYIKLGADYSGINIYSTPAEKLIEKFIGKFHFVICWNCIEYTYDWKLVIDNITKYSLNGGFYLISLKVNQFIENVSENDFFDEITKKSSIIKINKNILDKDYVILARPK